MVFIKGFYLLGILVLGASEELEDRDAYWQATSAPTRDLITSDMPGVVQELTGDLFKKAARLLSTSLQALDAADGPKYRVVEIIEASKQVVAGELYKYDVKLMDENMKVRQCKVEIWTRAWLKRGIQVTIYSKGRSTVSKNISWT